MNRKNGVVGLVTIMLILVIPAKLGAQKETDALDRYLAEHLELRLSFDGFEILRGGIEVEEDYDEVFVSSPLALEEINTYQTLNTVAWICYLTGLASMISSIIPAVYLRDDDRKLQEDEIILPASLFVGGVVISITGIVLMFIGDSHVNQAVDQYNRDLVKRIRD